MLIILQTQLWAELMALAGSVIMMRTQRSLHHCKCYFLCGKLTLWVSAAKCTSFQTQIWASSPTQSHIVESENCSKPSECKHLLRSWEKWCNHLSEGLRGGDLEMVERLQIVSAATNKICVTVVFFKHWPLVCNVISILQALNEFLVINRLYLLFSCQESYLNLWTEIAGRLFNDCICNCQDYVLPIML